MFSSQIFQSLKKQNEKKVSNYYWLHVVTVGQYIWMCLQYLMEQQKKQVQSVGSGKVCIDYRYRGETYKLMSRVPRGPGKMKKIQKILNENGVDCTEKIKPFMGPSLNWHGIPYQCSDFGVTCLSFYWNDGSCTSREKDELLFLS